MTPQFGDPVIRYQNSRLQNEWLWPIDRAGHLVPFRRQPHPDPADHIIHSERDASMSPGAVQVWFHRLYQDLGFAGASSHSGRRTFITRTAKKIVEAGGSLRDVQELAGHTSLSTTQRYIQGDTAAKRRVVDL